MKYIDKVKEMHPALTDREIYNSCPYYYDLELKPNPVICILRITCERCWNREMR